MEEKKKASAAHMRATAKWEKENYDKVLVSRKYVKGYKIKSFNSLIDAKEYAVDTYESMQNGASDFYRIGSLKNLNWFYYQKPVKKLFIQI